jgi:Bcr/CflA subfamily drug resistance transporter
MKKNLHTALMHHLYVPFWLIIVIICLPQFGEGFYSPSLPKIAETLQVSENFSEYTLSFFLISYAIGISFWGLLSDRIGRRFTMIISLSIYLVGCISCFFSTSFTLLMISRFIQAFGGSSCSIMGQAIAREVFNQTQRNKLFSQAGVTLSLVVGISPVLGGLIVERLHWRFIFMFLFLISLSVWIYVIAKLPETNRSSKITISVVSLLKGFQTLWKDKALLSSAILMGAANGILYCFYSEGSFYLIEGLRLKPSHYGWLYFLISLGLTAGSLYSHRCYKKGVTYSKILEYATLVLLWSTFSWALLAASQIISLENRISSIGLTEIFLSGVFFSVGIIIPNVLANALEKYSEKVGTMAAVFCSSYFLIATIINFIIGVLHNGNLYLLPLYYFVLSIIVFWVKRASLGAK